MAPSGTKPRGVMLPLDCRGSHRTSVQQADVPAVLDLWAQARSEHASVPDGVDDVERLVNDSPAALLVAERDGEIVGTLIAAWDGWRGNMYRLAVRDGNRRQGIGLALTRAGEAYLLSAAPIA